MKTDTRTLSPSAQESLRIRAVKAVLAGHTQVEVAGIFEVPRQTVGLWVKAHRRGGLRSLKAKKRGRPKGGTLLPWQAAQIVRAITDRTPDQLKLPFYLWTREAVGRLIEDRFGIRLSVWTGGRYLAQGGDAGHPRNRTEVRLQHDFRHHQPGSLEFHGLPRAVQGSGVPELPQTIGPPGSAEGFPDRGRPSGSPGRARHAMGEHTCQEDRTVPSAQLQPRPQSR